MKSKPCFYIFRFLPIVLMCVILSVMGCGGPAWVDDRLDVAETLMEERPDSALAILDSIHPAILKGEGQKARYALLKSMALDKNYIDKTSFEVLQPAIDYYAKNGTPDEKLRTYYYQGRIFDNRQERDSALRSYKRGLDMAKDCGDSLTIARALVAEAIIYKNFYDIEGYTENYFEAAHIYNRKSRESLEFDCLFNALNGMVISGKKEKADSIMRLLANFEALDIHQKQALQALQFSYVLKFGQEQDIRLLLDADNCVTLNSGGNLLNQAMAYNKVGSHERAIHVLNQLDRSHLTYDTLRYLSIRYQVLKDNGNPKDALDAYEEYVNRLEIINSMKFEQKSLSMEETHRLEMQAEKDSRKLARAVWGFTGGGLVLFLAIVVLILKNKYTGTQKYLAEEKARTSELENENLKAESERLELENRNLQLERDKKALEAENLANRVEELESESEGLKDLLESRQEMPAEVRKAIQTRIEMLNSYLASQISDHKEFEKTYDAWVADLTANTQEFMDSNRLAFQASHPAFIKYFEDHGLTTAEINYVCLYAIGLRGKDVGNYMRMRSHVNISSAIRKKLGIDQHETNIGIYVRKKLKEF